MDVHVAEGEAIMNAQHINFQVGSSKLQITPSRILINAPKVGFYDESGLAVQPISIVGSDSDCPKKDDGRPHNKGTTNQGSPDVFIEGFPAQRENDPVVCQNNSNDAADNPPFNGSINGQKFVRLNDPMKHGGVMATASASVFAGGQSPLVEFPPPLKTAERHWIQGQWKSAPKGTRWYIKQEGGGAWHGVVDSQGKTEKITGLAPGQATIAFGPSVALYEQLAKERNQLKATLDQIVTAAKQQSDALAKKYGLDDPNLSGWQKTKDKRRGKEGQRPSREAPDRLRFFHQPVGM